jgi:hypothetical protein
VAGGECIGVIQSFPQYTGDATTLVVSGITKVICGAALTPGTDVMSDASGHAVVQTSTNTKLGTVLGGTANSGELASIQLAIL